MLNSVFFSSVSIANSTPITSISSVDKWKQGWFQPVFQRSLVVIIITYDELIIKVQRTLHQQNVGNLDSSHQVLQKAIKEIGHQEGNAEKTIQRETKYFASFEHLLVKRQLKWGDSEFTLLRTEFKLSFSVVYHIFWSLFLLFLEWADVLTARQLHNL